MIVVSDTTPLNYLILIEGVEILAAIFGQVYAPTAVLRELSDERSPQAVRAWALKPPEWLTVQDPAELISSRLGPGEVAALSLAREIGAGRLLIDERDAGREAKQYGLVSVGTLGILLEASRRGLIDIEEKLTRLKATNFRASEALYRACLEQARGNSNPPV